MLSAAARAQTTDLTAELASRAALTHARPGDRVAVHVYGEPQLTDAATLDEQGRIMLPRIGMIQADAMPIAALRDTIRSRMSAFLRDPAIEVTVLRRIVVNGEVMRPAVYYVDLTATMGEAIAQAGGLRETASTSKVFLVRGSRRTQVKNWESDQSPTADLRSGDQIVVGRQSWLALNIIPVVGISISVVTLMISLRGKL
jgi:polysaccharide export outer membrane protein